MPTRIYYLQQSKLLRDMAAASSGPSLAASWMKRAREYDVLADAIGDPGDGGEPIPFESFEPQPQQQRQQQAQQRLRTPQRQQEQQQQQKRRTRPPATSKRVPRTPPDDSSR